MNMNNPNKLQIKNICSQSQIKSINTWINDFKIKKTIKPLYIYGNGGIGKTTLANLILEKYHYNIINLSSIYINNNNNIIGTINSVLINKSICMMFSENISYKGLIIDDLEHYIDSDKNIFNNILKILKNINDYSNNPIIIISNKINNNIYNILCKKCVIIKLKYTKNKIKEIIKNRLKQLNLYLNNTDIDKIIFNNNNNLTSIFENIKYINPIEKSPKGDSDYISLKNNVVFNNIIENEMIEYIKTLFSIDFDRDTISNILLEVNYDINILSLLILENTFKYVHNNSVKKYHNSLNTICKIYDNIIVADNFEHFKVTKIQKNNKLNNYIILHGIIYPIYYIYRNNNNKPQFIFKDTSIYSKSIIEIYNNKRQIYIESISNRFKNIRNFIKIYHHSKITNNKDLIDLCEKYIKNDIVVTDDILKYIKYNISKIYGYKIKKC